MLPEEDAAPSAVPTTTPPRQEIPLTGQQKALYEALTEKHADLGRIYLGAIEARENKVNPDRLAHAGHGLRELMEKLPEYIDLPVNPREQPMGVKVRELSVSWLAVKVDVEGGTLSKRLVKFLGELDAFFVWNDKQNPTRRERTVRVFRKLDPQQGKLPATIEKLRVEEWNGCNRFFQLVSHHRLTCTENEFAEWLGALERFLLGLLRPRTFDDYAILDQIIAEGEADAQP